MNDFCVRSDILPVRVCKILCADEPAMKSVRTAISAMAGGAVLREQSRGVHLLFWQIGLLPGQGADRGAAGDQPGQPGHDKYHHGGSSIYHMHCFPTPHSLRPVGSLKASLRWNPGIVN